MIVNMQYYFFLFPIVFAYNCEDICNVTLHVMENTPSEQLNWSLIGLLYNRTSIPPEYLQFSLSNPSDYFEIDSTILKFRLKELDREKICPNSFSNDECSLQLQIFTQTSLILLFQMIILDENDWKPLFNQNYIHFNIRENLPMNYPVQLPIAYDYDSNKYNIDYYKFIDNMEETEGIFQLEKSQDELRLKLLRKLDCEAKNNYQLYIIAIDKGGFKSNVLHVNITVGDINEYQPRFSERLYHARIPENFPILNSSSSPILQVIATDDDCDDKTILYSILNNDIPNEIFPFEIDKYTGIIHVKHSLDYETMSTYRFRVKASNLDQITSSIVPIIIDILDINDNRPLIQMNILSEYQLIDNDESSSININENIRLGQVIGTVLIRDMDSAMINHRLSLSILSCLPFTSFCPIELDSGIENNTSSPTTYLIRTSRQLDSEHGDEKFVIILEARDYGDPSLSHEYRLIVNINDENDCAPKFTRTNYRFRLSTSSPLGFFIGQIQANDDDYSPNFRLIQYKLLETDYEDIIRIDPNNGSLFIINQPSTELKFNITAIAMDQYNHSLYDRANLEILFFDKTSCLPKFSQAVYVFNTTEHQKIPYEIGQIHIDYCLSSSKTLSHHLILENSSFSLPFSLDNRTGLIKVINQLDREIQDFYEFYVYLSNPITKLTTETEIQINILDENDHYPIFDNPYEQYIYISIQNEQNNEIFITNIHATDADIDSNGLVNYYFSNTDYYAFFHLYSNGSIILYNRNNIQLPIRLEIYARDEGYPRALNSQENVVIYVCDIHNQHECISVEISNRLKRNFYLGSIVIMISVILFLFIIIICIIWNLFIKKQVRKKDSHTCQMEARKNLIISDGLDDSSPIDNENQHLQPIFV